MSSTTELQLDKPAKTDQKNTMIHRQPDLLEIEHQGDDALVFFSDSDIERGEVFTRREVVEFILDLADWTESADLSNARLLEPSAGSGDFLIPAIERLLASRKFTVASLSDRIRAVEVNRQAYEICHSRVDALLKEHGFTPVQRARLLDAWLIHGDFLTTPLESGFTHVVGNPPYVRQESIPPSLLRLYRARYPTMYDRADLYVPFFERGLSLLKDGGRLGFICADRWMKNKYGGPLRKLVSDEFHLESYVDFTGCPAFKDEVVAYPAVTIIKRSIGTITRTAHRPKVEASILKPLAKRIRSNRQHPCIGDALNVVLGDAPWLLDNPQRLNVIRGIEARFPRLEETGCRVGIGVATGVDKVYIANDEELPVESERKLPIVMTRDVVNGEIKWGGKMLLNPFDGDSTRLVKLQDYPEFAEYINTHRDAISRRHVAKKNPVNWFKTIDRIYPSLAQTPKLLIPDIKGEPTVVFDSGQFYPHHNFYYVTSDTWNLQALQAVLLSPVAQSIIATYSLRMRGDCLRYQAQYLRRIRLPLWTEVSSSLKKRLVAAGKSQNTPQIHSAVQELYQLDDAAWQLLDNT